jgi:hypothetical protein
MKSTLCLFLMMIFFCMASGGLYCIGEKTISLGGASGWSAVGNRSGITEAAMVRNGPVLVLSTGGGGSPAAADKMRPDMAISFDEGNTALFRDSAAHYRVTVTPALEAVDRRYARAGTGAALFSMENKSSGTIKPGSMDTPLIVKPQSRNALFSSGAHIGDFTLEFWLYPLNLENGEQILSWIASRPVADKNGRVDYGFQQILCTAAKNRLQWSFLDFFSSPGNKAYIDISLAGTAPVVPKNWSHHLIRFDSSSGMLEYMVNGQSEAIVYASSSGHEGGEVYTPIAGEDGSFALGGSFMGLMDEFKIYGAWVSSPAIRQYPRRGGRIETQAIDLGEENSGVLKVEASGGRTSISAMRINGEFQENGRFRFTDDSELQFFIRAAENPYQWDDRDWQAITPGALLAGNIRGRYVQLAVDFYPSASGDTSPYLEELRITYLADEPPLPPASVSAVAMDGGVQLRWKSSPDSDTAGYLVYYGTASDDYFGEGALLGSSPIDAGKRNSILIDGLTNGTLYYFRLAAYDRQHSSNPAAFQAGEFSREVRARPLQGLSSLSLQTSP